MYTFKSQLFNHSEIKRKLHSIQHIQKTFFYDNEWLEILYDMQKNKKNIFYVEIFQKETVLMILLFEIKKFFFLKKLTWSFNENLNFITPIILNNHNFDKKNFNSILKKIFDHFDVDYIQLDKNPRMVENKFNPLNFYKNFNYEKIFKINLKNDSWNDYYKKISSPKTKQTDRRKKKLLSKKGKINFLITNELDDKKKIFDFTLQNKIFFLKDRKLDYKNFENLYKKLFEKIVKNPKYICSALKVNNKIVAAIVGRIQNNNYYYLIPSNINKDYSQYSPGRILLKEQIKWCFENNLHSFDFGPGNFRYKNTWSNDHENYYRIFKPKSFFGLILFFLLKIKLKLINSSFVCYIRSILK